MAEHDSAVGLVVQTPWPDPWFELAVQLGSAEVNVYPVEHVMFMEASSAAGTTLPNPFPVASGAPGQKSVILVAFFQFGDSQPHPVHPLAHVQS